MIRIHKYVKIIAYTLIGLILFQSCVVYHPSIPSRASESTDARIRIKTVHGEKYIFRWIEKKNNNVYSILNTEKNRIPIDEIKEIKSLDGNRLSLDAAIQYTGLLEVYTKKSANQLYGEFFKLEKVGGEIIALEQIGKDTVTVVIPIKDILRVEVEKTTASNIYTILLVLGVITGALIAYGIIDVLINGIDIQP